MGCDIHIVVERQKKIGGPWIGVYCTDVVPVWGRLDIARRDYGFFAEVAQVRGNGTEPRIYPRNIPEDVSALAWQQYMHCPRDYHSASYMNIAEFSDAWFRANPERPSEDKQYPPNPRRQFAGHDLLGIDSDDERYIYRVVFWFDN